ncbi:hypothetical protein GCM10027176_11570 [Actinoallomurus bryophytorum]|uniref:Uncharacterized protein n=1 Tax=Actinoallomurus bryophytorum TaxID=1490222 RepID=A0A543CQ84_9ACTN|nr:hypothetical protein [Actinoallomurus bryophytorum]TQL99264.1 hypothetical protein FB559_4921 [Actinoallomurus bryophytorum]
MAEQRADGYTVDTTAGLRGFRDGTLANVAGGLPDLGQMIAAAGLTPDAFPSVVAGAGRKRDATLDTMLRTVRGLTSTADGHIDDLTRAAAGYDGAEDAALATVAGRDPAPGADRPSAKDPNGSVPSTIPADTTSPAGAGPDAVLALYGRLEKLCGALGLANAIRPAGALLTANVRDPQPFGDAARRLDQAQASASRLHADVPAGLDLLAADWTGQAHDAHRDATLNTYQPPLAALQDHAQNLAYKDLQSQDAQRRFHDRMVIILGWAFMVLSVLMAMVGFNFMFAGAVLRGIVWLGAAFVFATVGAVKALYTDWPE